MSRSGSIQNEDSNNSSEDSIFNQCESCCRDVQQAHRYAYKCVYNDVLHQCKMRLKRAQMELSNKDLIIGLLRDQHAKMENYCRCSLEESQDIKARYHALVQEMEHMRRENETGRFKSTVENDGTLMSYLRSEVDMWKKENKEIMDKIELMDFDLKKLLHVVSRSPTAAPEDFSTARMSRLEEAIEKQSEVLAMLNSKVAENSAAIIVSNQLVASKLSGILEKADKSRDDIRDELLYLKKQTESLTKNSYMMQPDRASIMETYNFPTIPSTVGESSDYRRVQPLDQRVPAVLVIPVDDPKESMRPYQKVGDQEARPSDSSPDDASRTPRPNTTVDAATNTHPKHPFKNAASSATNSEMLADFLEIAAKEKKFFDDRSAVSDASVFTGRSQASELTPSELDKIFRELPMESTRSPQKEWDGHDNFHGFERFESARFSGGENLQIGPTRDEKGGLEEPAVKGVQKCCIVPNAEIDSSPSNYENNLQMVVFKGIPNDKIPACCTNPEESEETLKIEEVGNVPEDILPTLDETSSLLPQEVDIPKAIQEERSPTAIPETQKPKMDTLETLPLVLDELSSLPPKEEGIPEATHQPTRRVVIPDDEVNREAAPVTETDFQLKNSRNQSKPITTRRPEKDIVKTVLHILDETASLASTNENPTPTHEPGIPKDEVVEGASKTIPSPIDKSPKIAQPEAQENQPAVSTVQRPVDDILRVPFSTILDETSSLQPKEAESTRTGETPKDPSTSSGNRIENPAVLKQSSAEAPSSKGIEDKAPDCCKIPGEDVVIEKISRTKKSISNYKTPNREETDDIPIIYDLEIDKIPILEEEFGKKFIAPYSEEIVDHSKASKEDLTVENSPKLLEDLREVLNQLGEIVAASKKETSTLQDLKEDFKIAKDEWTQDVVKIETNIDVTNRKLNGIQQDVKSLKNDIENLLHEEKRRTVEESSKVDQNNVLEKVQNLEKRLCKCGSNVASNERKRKICKPSTGCSCRLRSVEDGSRSKGENSTNGKRISFTIQSCVLSADSIITPPYIMRFRNDDFLDGFPSITYKKNSKCTDKQDRKGKSDDESPDY